MAIKQISIFPFEIADRVFRQFYHQIRVFEPRQFIAFVFKDNLLVCIEPFRDYHLFCILYLLSRDPILVNNIFFEY